jgi:hypothetical protein
MIKLNKKMACWFALGFIGGLVFVAAANAGVQFLPQAMSGGRAAVSKPAKSNNCAGYSSQAKQGPEWSCQTCVSNGVTKYKCKKVSTGNNASATGSSR